MKSKVNLPINCFLIGIAILVVACSEKTEHKNTPRFLLPVLGPKKTVNEGQSDTIYHAIGPYKLINQYKDTVSEITTENKIYVANFFFATCESICPDMSSQMNRVQNEFKNDTNLIILSHSVNPLHDTAEVLFTYSVKYNAIKNKWHFLTGSKKTIYDLAKNDYLVNALEDDGTPEGFLHSELFLLIDKQKRIRGMYDGTDSVQVNKLLKDIQLLKTEK